MGEKVINFKNGVSLEFDQGVFDKWCIYITDAEGKRSAPKDIDYFSALKNLSKKYGGEQIYKDFVSFYEITNKELDPEVFNKINMIASYYGENSIEIEILFSIWGCWLKKIRKIQGLEKELNDLDYIDYSLKMKQLIVQQTL